LDLDSNHLIVLFVVDGLDKHHHLALMVVVLDLVGVEEDVMVMVLK
jgi:hypothetical protein